MRRPTCPTCLRAQSACICSWVRPLAHRVQVIILQHPIELTQAKGTGRLLHLSLPRSQLLVGETFDTAQLHNVLARQRTVLLYPSTQDDISLLPASAAPTDWLQDPASLCLVVLDATWRKSRKMLHQNLWLQLLPRMALQHPPASRYLIRKAHGAHQLSTLEATCAALAQLEGQDDMCAPLLSAFNGFVQQQLGYRLGSGL
jgi:DTW domain-containing protein